MIVNFKIDHIHKMNASHLIGMDLSAYRHTAGPANTLILDDIPVACGGIHELWKGVGEAWLILGDEALEHSVIVLRHVVILFKRMVRDFHRIQANVLSGFNEGVQLVSALGFKLEGPLKQYGPNKEDYQRYVILR